MVSVCAIREQLSEVAFDDVDNLLVSIPKFLWDQGILWSGGALSIDCSDHVRNADPGTGLESEIIQVLTEGVPVGDHGYESV